MLIDASDKPRLPLVFLAVTVLAGWATFIPVAAALHGRSIEDGTPWVLATWLVGGWSPTLLALGFAAATGGRTGLRTLLQKLVRWRVGAIWWVVALFVPAGMAFVSILPLTWTGHIDNSPEWGRLALLPVAIVAALPFGPLGEELGWRGYALPGLVTRFGGLVGSLILGVFWTAWHVPLFWAPAGTAISGMPVSVPSVLAFTAILLGQSLLYTWVLAGTRGSVLMAVVLHASFNVPVTSLLFPGVGVEVQRLALYVSLVPTLAVAAVVVPRVKGLRSLAGEKR